MVVKVGAEEHGAMDVETGKVDVDDFVDHLAVLRQPYGDL